MKKWKVLSARNKVASEEEIIDELFKLRKISDKKGYLNPSADEINLNDSGINKKELKKAIKRINKAIENNERIVILGDYDVDGICASAILWETIYSKYKNVFPYIPDRFSEGYGMSNKSIDNVLEKYPDVKLIITVDNGIVAVDSADYAMEKGIDLIITDHHLQGNRLPKASAIVHTTKLCGAGVSWMLACELDFLNKSTVSEKLELAALATIADLVPLVDLNRLIVKFGLEYLHNTKRVGLIELFKTSGIDKRSIGTYQIGYIIAPRLNASGRIGHAIDSLRLICTNDRSYASKSAMYLENTNRTRQKMVVDSISHAKLSVVKSDIENVVVVSHESYSEGIVGLLASRLVEEHYRPAIAISVKNNISKGSARSINGVNIVEMLRSVSSTLLEVGGHPMAAGFSIKTEKIQEFVLELSSSAKRIPRETFDRDIKIDMIIPLCLVSESLYKKIQELSPFGMGNPEPIFASRKITVLGVRRLGKDGSHLKLVLENGDKNIEALGFGMGALEIEEKNEIDIAFTIDINEWRDRRTLQLMIKDLVLT